MPCPEGYDEAVGSYINTSIEQAVRKVGNYADPQKQKASTSESPYTTSLTPPALHHQERY